MTDWSYRSAPALAAYIERIGAEELNFRRFMVKEHRGEYYVERSLIIINSDGTVTCSNRMHEPTKEEAEQIKRDLTNVKFPTSIGASKRQVDKLKAEHLKNGTVYEFVDRTGHVVMVQERTTIDGKKIFIPWSFWSDSAWRKMEPEGKLPFWRPTAEMKKAGVMIHEGAKAAKFVTDLVKDPERRKKHPWGETLALYEHWGIIGGALAPHRANYDDLIREKPSEVIYVCDNDFPGRSALQEVSRCYGRAMKGIMFDERWPMAWDMADAMPRSLFASGGRYVGPQLQELVKFATRATEQVQNGGRGKPTAVIKSEFEEEWFHSVTPEVFIHKDWPNRIYTSQEFNNFVRPYSDVDDTARLIKSSDASKSGILKYDPGTKPGIYGDDSGRYINTHCPTSIKPAESGDPAPFLEYMEHLVEAEGDRHELLKWCATLIARPAVRMIYGVLLISEVQGVGKGTLGEKILAPLVGLANVSYPSEREIVESGFNYWLAHKRLGVVHEIYAGHSSKAYNTLKSIITDKYITVSKKFQANYEIENWMHVFACSNSMRAIQLTMDDRRWLVPKVTEKKRPVKYWTELNRWLNDENGLGIIMTWAESFVSEHGAVTQGSPAPWTELKKEIVEEGYSQGQALVAKTLDRLRAAIEGSDIDLRERLERAGHLREDQLVILDEDFVELIKNVIYDGRHNDRIEKPLTIRKVAKSHGWHIGDSRVFIPSLRRAHGARMICSTKSLSEKSPSQLFGARAEGGAGRLLPVDLAAFRGL